eukprot:GHVN01051625.1.p2 GENE.GHVN01051625.1~~GHVN01051625.1.p2  ORF type:complete len:189 (-),score=21.29 GHVN01051625.1:2723-3289(-)
MFRLFPKPLLSSVRGIFRDSCNVNVSWQFQCGEEKNPDGLWCKQSWKASGEEVIACISLQNLSPYRIVVKKIKFHSNEERAQICCEEINTELRPTNSLPENCRAFGRVQVAVKVGEVADHITSKLVCWCESVTCLTVVYEIHRGKTTETQLPLPLTRKRVLTESENELEKDSKKKVSKKEFTAEKRRN